MAFPARDRGTVPISIQRRIPFLVNTDLVMLLFFLVASTVRFMAQPAEYRSFFFAVWATSLAGYTSSLVLVRRKRYGLASYAGTVSSLLNVCWLSFLLPVESILDFYRFGMYVAVAIIANSLVALGRRQVQAFGAATVLAYVAYTLGMMVPHFGLADPELKSVAATLLGVIVLSNVFVLYIARISADLIDLAVRDAGQNLEKAERLGHLIQGSRGSLRIGEELAKKAEESIRGAGEVRSRIAALEGQARTLSADARGAEESNSKVAEFTNALRDSVISQNEVIHETSAARVEIAATVGNLAAVATAKRSGIDAVLSGFEGQRAEMRKVVEGMERIRESSALVLGSAGLILDVSEKTDLLAMNASIEAAHSGSSGKGFAVIAMEIRKLSDEAKRGSESITAALRENNSVISGATGLVTSFQEAFEGTMAEIRDTFDAMEEIIRGLSEMEMANDELRAATQVLTDIAIKTETGVSDVATRTSLGAEGVRRISRFSDELLEAIGLIRNHFGAMEGTMASIEEIGRRNIDQIAVLGKSLDEVNRG